MDAETGGGGEHGDGGELAYPIKAVARLTGLAPDTIRAWERRYGAVRPSRSSGGQRLYARREVERLALLRRVVEAGQAIGRVAALSDAELVRLAGVEPAMGPAPALPGFADRVYEALRRYDRPAMDRELRLAAGMLSPRRLAFELALPLIVKVGEGWEAGEIGIAQEHLATQLLEALLATSLRVADARPGAAPVLLATPPGELHELGLLCVALVVAAHGTPICYLGAQVPMHELAAAARATGARAVGLGLAIVPDPEARARELVELVECLPAGCAVWLGGRGGATVTRPPGVRYFPTLEAVEAALEAHAL